MVFCGYWKTLPSGSSLMLHITLTLFPLCNGICCSISNYYLNNSNSVLHYMCLYYVLSGWNYIISPKLNYWRMFLTDLSCDISLWVLKNCLDRERRSRHLQVIISLNLYDVWCETILHSLVNTKSLMLFLDHTYGFNIGTTRPYLKYLTYAQMDVHFS